MSKNVVDAIIEFGGGFGFIPSRRQVDYNGGYVNNWTTGEFCNLCWWKSSNRKRSWWYWSRI